MPKFSMPELPPVFADLQKKVADVMASGPAAEVEKHMKQALSVALSKLDLVSREEFEQQQLALARAQAQLKTLEARLAELQSAEPSKTQTK
ncbi:MAG: accessory factor UbiK family protein [Burkholderiaceae bacterium]